MISRVHRGKNISKEKNTEKTIKDTKESNKLTGNQLEAYMKQMDELIEFWEYAPEKLNKVLGKCWFSAR